jgi:hypothetical protein
VKPSSDSLRRETSAFAFARSFFSVAAIQANDEDRASAKASEMPDSSFDRLRLPFTSTGTDTGRLRSSSCDSIGTGEAVSSTVRLVSFTLSLLFSVKDLSLLRSYGLVVPLRNNSFFLVKVTTAVCVEDAALVLMFFSQKCVASFSGSCP